jgi:hypothetical protein
MAFAAPVALAAGVIGAGVSAYGTMEAGQAQAAAANYQAQVQRNNAIIAEQNAQYAEKAGQVQAGTQSLKSAAAGGKIKAAQAASGVDVNTGSAVDVQEAQREGGKLDTETVLSNAELQAYGYRSQGANFQAEAGLEQMEAEQAPIGADLAAGGQLLSGASGLGFKWSQLGNNNTAGP